MQDRKELVTAFAVCSWMSLGLGLVLAASALGRGKQEPKRAGRDKVLLPGPGHLAVVPDEPPRLVRSPC